METKVSYKLQFPMSKKHKNRFSFASSEASANVTALVSEHADEYRFVQGDLIRLVIVNALFLAGMLALYYTNQQSHYLERWFSQIKF